MPRHLDERRLRDAVNRVEEALLSGDLSRDGQRDREALSNIAGRTRLLILICREVNASYEAGRSGSSD